MSADPEFCLERNSAGGTERGGLSAGAAASLGDPAAAWIPVRMLPDGALAAAGTIVPDQPERLRAFSHGFTIMVGTPGRGRWGVLSAA